MFLVKVSLSQRLNTISLLMQLIQPKYLATTLIAYTSISIEHWLNRTARFFYCLIMAQIHWLNYVIGIGFLSAVTIMCEIGDFSSFKNPKHYKILLY